MPTYVELRVKKTITALLLFNLAGTLVLPVSSFAVGGETAAQSSITINSQIEGARVFLDGKATGFTTPLPAAIPANPGFYKIKVEKKGYTTWRKDFLLTSGENIVLDVVMVPLDVTDAEKAAFSEIGKKPYYKKWWFRTIMVVAIGAALSGLGSADDDSGSITGVW